MTILLFLKYCVDLILRFVCHHFVIFAPRIVSFLSLKNRKDEGNRVWHFEVMQARSIYGGGCYYVAVCFEANLGWLGEDFVSLWRKTALIQDEPHFEERILRNIVRRKMIVYREGRRSFTFGKVSFTLNHRGNQFT